MRSFLIALAFLTVVPIRFLSPPTADEVARSRFWYPCVGLLLGLALAGMAYILGLNRVYLNLIAFLLLAVWTLATGGLHLDGLADLADGLFGGRNPEDRLRIMRDPHIGAFGVIAIVLAMLGKFVALRAFSMDRTPLGLANAVFLARCFALVMAGLTNYARQEGTGHAIITATRRNDAVLMLCITAVVMGAEFIFFPDIRLPVAAGASLTAVLMLTWLCHRRLGGTTGDCLGAAIEVSELVFLLAWVI